MRSRVRRTHRCHRCGGSFVHESPVEADIEVEGVECVEDVLDIADPALRDEMRARPEHVPCPGCGAIQPEMDAWAIRCAISVALLLCVLYVFLVVLWVCQGALFMRPAPVFVAAVGSAALLVVLWRWVLGVRGPRGVGPEAASVLERGTPRPPGPKRASWVHRPPVLVWLLLLAVLLMWLPELLLAGTGWPVNGSWRPVLLSPGCRARVSVPVTESSVDGSWSGEASAALVQAPDGIDVPMPLHADTHSSVWGDEIQVLIRRVRKHVDPWVRITFPDIHGLEGQRAVVRTEIRAVFPSEVTPPSGSVSGRYRNMPAEWTREHEIVFAPAGASETYQVLWYGSAFLGPLLLLVSLLGLRSWISSRCRPSEGSDAVLLPPELIQPQPGDVPLPEE